MSWIYTTAVRRNFEGCHTAAFCYASRWMLQGFGETYLHNPKIVSDMTALHYIHEAGILYNLGRRAVLDNQRPYTFMVRNTGRGTKPRGTRWLRT